MTENLTLSHAKQKPEPAIRVYLGGSFDPVHNAHIQMAMHVYNALLPLASHQRKLHVSLLPNARSPFKSNSTAPKQRLAMLKLAVQNTPLQINELELWQAPPVYTIDSVTTLRQRYPHDILIFIMGMDSARSLDNWKAGLQLTDYVNLWVFNRSASVASKTHNGKVQTADQTSNNTVNNEKFADKALVIDSQLDSLIYELPHSLKSQVTASIEDLLTPLSVALSNNASSKNNTLKTQVKGRIYIDTQPIVNISSSEIRETLFELYTAAPIKDNVIEKKDNVIENDHYLSKYLDSAVYHYIMQHKLYSSA